MYLKKRLFILLIVILFNIGLVGCDFESKEKVYVDFIIEGESMQTKVVKGKILSLYDVPIDDKEKINGLFYDIDCTIEYKDENINEDVTIYVALKDESLGYLEKEDLSLVTFIIQKYTYALSSVPGPTMKFHKENAIFECTIDKGSFEYFDKVNSLVVSADETVMWCPSYVINHKTPNSTIVEEIETKAYMDVIIKIDNKIVGFIILEMVKMDTIEYDLQVLASITFLEINNEYQDVPLSYVLERIQDIKK